MKITVKPSFTVRAVPDTSITRLALRNRFTFAEKVDIETAAETDPVIRVLLKDLEAANYIDLSRSESLAAMQVLESKGILAEGRSVEIMDADAITDMERP